MTVDRSLGSTPLLTSEAECLNLLAATVTLTLRRPADPN